MKIKDLQLLLNKLDIKPSKKLGQNFLIDDNLLDYINKTAAVKENDFIVEVGPGLGALTKLLIESKAKVKAVEYDSRLAEYIRNKYSAPNFQLIHEDACKLDFNKLVNEDDFRIIANLPYSITTPLIARFIDMPLPPKDMLFLLQKETAERLSALPDSKNYGSITVQIKNVYEPEYLRTVPPEVFYPRPIVQSAIIKFTRKANYPSQEMRKTINKIVRSAFSQRRKKAVKNLGNEFKNLNIPYIFDSLEIDTNVRAENITPEQYFNLAKAISTPISS